MALAPSPTWREALNAFEHLLALEPNHRARELDSLQKSRPELYPQVMTLLDADRKAREREFLAEPPVELSEAMQTLRPGERFGQYRLERPLGAGGMGEVWLASRADGLYEGHVALKMLHGYLAGSVHRERFAREGRMLAKLQHPHIARLLDAGVSPAGQLYLAIEHVEGERLDRYCDDARLGIEQRLRLFLSICDAVSHAHANLIVHRDLKPSNILVTIDGVAKLLDFGIAKLLDAEGTGAESTELTRLGGQALTPEYASPEQILGQPLTTATDVYSLGVILYRLLCGVSPYAASEVTAWTIERRVVELEPVPPSQARPVPPDTAAEIAARRGLTPPRLRAALAGDLDTIVMSAMRKAPAERYASVLALAEDVQRSLDHRPVLAQPDAIAYRVRKFLRRNRLAVTAWSAVCIALVAGLWQMRAANLDLRRQVAHWSEVGAQELEQGATGRAAVALSHAYMLGRSDPALRIQLAQAMQSVDALVLRVRTEEAPVSRVTLSADGSKVAAISNDHRFGVWETSTGKTLITADLGEPFRRTFKPVFSPDGRFVMAHGWVRHADVSYVAVSLFDVAAGRQIASLETAGSLEAEPQHPFDASDRFVFVSRDRMAVNILQLPQATASLVMPFTSRQRVATFSPDGGAVLVGAQDGPVALFDSHTGTKIRDFPGIHANVTAIGMSEDGRRVIAGGAGVAGAPIRVWDAQTGEQLIAGGQQFTINLVRFSRDGQRYLSVADDGVRVWSSSVGSVTLAPSAPVDHAKWHALSPDGQTLAFTDLGPAAMIDVRSGRRSFDLDAHTGGALDVAFDEEGARLATAGADGTIGLWKIGFRPRWRHELGHSMRGADRGDAAYDARFSPDGTRFATSGSDGTVEIRKTADASLLLALPVHAEGVYGAFWSADGQRLLATGEDGVLRLFDTAAGTLIARMETGRQLRGYEHALFSADGRRAIVIGDDLSLAPQLVDLDTHRIRGLPLTTAQGAIRFLHAGGRVVVGAKGRVTLLDAATGSPIWDLSVSASGTEIGAVAVSSNDAQILVAVDKQLLLVDAERGAILRHFEHVFASPVNSASFSPDGKAIALTNEDREAYLWRLDETSPRPLVGHTGRVDEARFSPDGTEVLTRSWDGTARLWSAATGQVIAIVAQHRSSINAADFDPGGKWIVTAGTDNVVALWDVGPERRSAKEIEARLRCAVAWRVAGEALVPAALPAGSACEPPSP